MDRLYRIGLRLAWIGLRSWQRASGGRTTGVAVVVRSGGRLLLIRNSYRDYLGVPGGGARRGEGMAAAARRELFEETGIRAHPQQLRPWGSLETHHSGIAELVHFFELECEDEPEVRVDRREVVEAVFRSPASARSLSLWPPLEEYLRRVYGGG